MPSIRCPNCQKEYRWKPELAGKRVKCKCGGVISVPAEETPEPNDLYDLADDAGGGEQHEHAIGDLAALAAPAASAVEEANQFRCPYCGQGLEPGAAMCVYCGTSFAAKAAAAKKPPSAMAAAPPPAARPVKVKGQQEVDRSGTIKLAVLAIIGLVIVVGAVFGLKHFAGKSTARDPNLKPSDVALLNKIDDQNGVEAREWLNKNDQRMMGGWSHKQAIYHVDEWYKMGAKKVYAMGAIYSMTVILELPDDAAQRKALFDWAAKWHEEQFIKPDKDVGQKYLEIQMKM